MTSASVTPPAPLTVTASLAAVEGMVLGLLAVVEAFSTSAERVMLGVTTTIFFTVCCLGLLVCAYGLQRARSWARGPVLLAQLIAFGVAWEIRDLGWVAGLLVVVGLVALAGVVHPASMNALEEQR